MNENYAYELGKFAALDQLKLTKVGVKLPGYLLPTAGGGAAGAGVGAMMAPEGERGTGALIGAGLGAAGGAGGKALGKSLGAKHVAQKGDEAKQQIDQMYDEALAPGGFLHPEQGGSIADNPEFLQKIRQLEEQAVKGQRGESSKAITGLTTGAGAGLGAGAGGIGAGLLGSEEESSESNPYMQYASQQQ